KKLGQLFCDFSSKQIVDLLQKECADARVEIQLNCRVQDVKKDSHFKRETTLGPFECNSLVIASGGLSFPKIGATDFGYRIAQQFGIKLATTRAGLVPIVFEPADQTAFAEL